MFGLNAPPPSGPSSHELRQMMYDAADSSWFHRKVNLWSRLRRTGTFPWDAFLVCLRAAEFREFRDKRQAKRSVGWAGQNPANPEAQWLFGVCRSLRRARTVGRSILDHELFHAVQDVQSGGWLFRPLVPLCWWQDVLVEVEAHLFGGPLIGLPCLMLLAGLLAVGAWMLWELLTALLVLV
jgi:hypothetical protein